MPVNVTKNGVEGELIERLSVIVFIKYEIILCLTSSSEVCYQFQTVSSGILGGVI